MSAQDGGADGEERAGADAGTRPADTSRPDFAKMDGLLPVVSQDARTGRVLTLAFQDEEAWRRTLETGEVHFWSRSRNELWRKGETSGNTQRVEGVVLDCDADSAVLLVTPAGPACHTGAESCFHDPVPEGTGDDSSDESPLDGPVLDRLWRTLRDRAEDRPEGSYTVRLLDDADLRHAKVAEEADELVRASAGESDARVAEEAADLLYHLLCILLARGVPPEAVLDVLRERMA